MLDSVDGITRSFRLCHSRSYDGSVRITQVRMFRAVICPHHVVLCFFLVEIRLLVFCSGHQPSRVVQSLALRFVASSCVLFKMGACQTLSKGSQSGLLGSGNIRHALQHLWLSSGVSVRWCCVL